MLTKKAMLKKNSLQVQKPVSSLNKSEESKFDLYGSYTGIDFYDNFDTPVQDVDDL